MSLEGVQRAVVSIEGDWHWVKPMERPLGRVVLTKISSRGLRLARAIE